MSHYVSPEQRQIRELRSTISRLQNQLNDRNSVNAATRRQLDLIRRQLENERQQMEVQMRRQQELAQRDQRAMSAALRDLDAQVREKERLQNEKLREMQAQHAAQANRLSAQIAAERETLQNEIGQTRAQMNARIERLREDTARQLLDERAQTQHSIAALDAKLSGRISAVDGKVAALAQALADKDNSARELAVYWAQEAARLLAQLRESFPAQLFDKKRVGHLALRIENANSDIKSGQYGPAITAGRDAFYDALDMKEELAVAQIEWNARFQSVKQREAQLLEDLDAALNRAYSVEVDGRTVTDTSGIDYWTNGQLSVVRARIDELREALERADEMTTQELTDAEAKLRALAEELALVENASHINFAMSQARFQTAAQIGAILGDSYAMIDADGDFFATENREEYHAIFENPDTHDQIAVVITPVPDKAGIVQNHVELLVGNADNDPVTRDRIAQAVAEKLRDYGMEGCSFPCTQRHGNHTREEVARVGNIEAVAAGQERTRAAAPYGAEKQRDVPAGITRVTSKQ